MQIFLECFSIWTEHHIDHRTALFSWHFTVQNCQTRNMSSLAQDAKQADTTYTHCLAAL